METLGNMESQLQQNKEFQKFLLKMSSPIVRKERKDVKMYYFMHNINKTFIKNHKNRINNF